MAKFIDGKLVLSQEDINLIMDKAANVEQEYFGFTLIFDGRYEFEFDVRFKELCRDDSSSVYGPYYTTIAWTDGELRVCDLGYDLETGDEVWMSEESMSAIQKAAEKELSYILV